MKRFLLLVSQFGIFFMSLFGGFLRRIAPPEEEQFWTGLATVIAGSVFLLVKVKSQTLDAPQRERRFYRLSLLVLPLSIVLFASYQWLIETRTASYAGGRKVIGGELTERGRSAKQLGNSNLDLLENNGGNPQGIWSERSITRSRMLLGSAYASAIGLFSLGLIAGCQALKESP